MNSEQFYQKQIAKSEGLITLAHRKVRTFMLLRLIVFALAVLALYFSWGSAWLFSVVFVVGLILFLTAVNHFVDAKLALEKASMLKKINQHELSVLAGDWSMMDAGLDFVDAKHAFSYDLDLFSPKGAFGYVNRTFTQKGKKMLADRLLNGVPNPEEVNEMIEALSSQIAWSQEFRVAGSIDSRTTVVNTSITPISKLKIKFTQIEKWAIGLIPIVSITAVILYNYELIGSLLLTILLIIPLLIAGRKLKETNHLAEQLSKFEDKIKAMKEQILSLKELTTNQLSVRLITDSLNDEVVSALDEYLKIQHRLQVRMNIVIGIPLNIFLAWDLRCRNQYSFWSDKYASEVEAWETKLAELEVLIAGATLRFNYPSTTYAQLQTTQKLKIEGLKHPLISFQKAVANDVYFNDSTQFFILTGPNMAGKSTYLRGLGLVIVFANAGFPVFAKNIQLPFFKLYTSMRTSDDLSNESSYFHAELTRLQYIMNSLERGENVFILLDEILKGTNSKDKEEGSKKFLKKLQRLNAKGVIATHDLALCQLAEESETFVNKCFDSTINGAILTFDYSLRDGICQNMNASFLLRKMNLVDE